MLGATEWCMCDAAKSQLLSQLFVGPNQLLQSSFLKPGASYMEVNGLTLELF